MAISFEGFHAHSVTFYQQEMTAPGAPVVMAENDTVTGAADGGKFCGVCQSLRGDYAGVQLSGAVTLPYSGTAPAVGYGKLTADGNGGVKTNANGREYLILTVDTADKTVTFLL